MYNCDKCGQEILPEYNNIGVVVAIAEAMDNDLLSDRYTREYANATLFNKPSRHFLPVYDAEGKMLCEGSPSRAQFIEGQPRDTRGFVEYTGEFERLYRAAHAKAQEMYPE